MIKCQERVFAGVMAICVVLLSSLPGWPDVPRQMNYQGFLRDAAGQPLSGSFDFIFLIYPDSTGGSPVWGPEGHSNVEVQDGFFEVLLGSVVPIDPSLFDGGTLWLEIWVESQPLAPRKPIATTPYAFRADLGPPGAAGIDSVFGGNGLLVENPQGPVVTLHVGDGPGVRVTQDSVSVASGTGITVEPDGVSLDLSFTDSRYIEHGEANSVTCAMIAPTILSSLNSVSNDCGNVDLVPGTPNVTITPDPQNHQIEISVSGGGGEPGDDTVLSQHIREADGTSGQDTNTGSGIKTGHIQDGAVTSAKIADETITSSDIAAGAIGSSELASECVTESKLAAAAVTSAKIASAAVTTSKLAAYAVTGDKIALNTIGDSQVTDNSLTASSLAPGAVGNSELASNAVTGDKIQDATISQADVANGYVDLSSSQTIGGWKRITNQLKLDRGIYVPDPGPDGNAVYVYNNSSSYPTIWAKNNSGNNAVYARTNSSSYAAIYGRSDGGGNGIFGETSASGYVPVFGWQNGGGYAVWGRVPSSSQYGLGTNGLIYAGGSLGFVGRFESDEGAVPAVAVQSVNAELILSGSSRLEGGKARVKIEPRLAGGLSRHVEPVVIVTPTGPCNGLYVEEKSVDGFSVSELGGGQSSAEFDWIMIARKRGLESDLDRTISLPEEPLREPEHPQQEELGGEERAQAGAGR
jgi:hypothetical protein